MLGVIVGRFQVFHRGHLDLIAQALMSCDRLAIVLGSDHSARNLRNPFLASERQEMIELSLSAEQREKIEYLKVRDYFYKPDFWVSEVREKVRGLTKPNEKVKLFGFLKDATTSYLEWFKDWEFVSAKQNFKIDATSIRQNYLNQGVVVSPFLLEPVSQWLRKFSERPEYRELSEEQKMIDQYKKSFSQSPYPPIFVTCDALIVQSGHILLIRRAKSPGKNLLALPGGFLEPDELIETGVLRELREETNFSMSSEELRKKLVSVKIFDHPLRSSRGRTITHVHYFKLDDQQALVGFQASDDAAEAFWLSILDL